MKMEDAQYRDLPLCMGAEYLSYVKYIATFALTFYRYIISVLASVLTSITYAIFEVILPYEKSVQSLRYWFSA